MNIHDTLEYIIYKHKLHKYGQIILIHDGFRVATVRRLQVRGDLLRAILVMTSCIWRLYLQFSARPNNSSLSIWTGHPALAFDCFTTPAPHGQVFSKMVALGCHEVAVFLLDSLRFTALLTRSPAAIKVFPTVSILVIPCSWAKLNVA